MIRFKITLHFIAARQSFSLQPRHWSCVRYLWKISVAEASEDNKKTCRNRAEVASGRCFSVACYQHRFKKLEGELQLRDAIQNIAAGPMPSNSVVGFPLNHSLRGERICLARLYLQHRFQLFRAAMSTTYLPPMLGNTLAWLKRFKD